MTFRSTFRRLFTLPCSALTPMSGLSRSAIIIGLVSLLGDISSEMIYPILRYSSRKLCTHRQRSSV